MSFHEFRQSAKEKLARLGRHWSSISLIGGFVFDFFTLWRIDLWLEDLIFIVYIFVAALGITYLTLHEAGMVRGKWADRFHFAFLIVLQFVFGGLFGRFFIFYSRSGSISASWPFLIFFVALFVINERLRDRYTLFTYRMSVFFITLFSFLIFYIPIIAGDMGPSQFLLSGTVSVLLMAAFGWLLFSLVRDKSKFHHRRLVISIGSIFLVINLMYFTNLIPPIPLSIESEGVYHDVHREGDGYVGTHEPAPWYEFFKRYETVHLGVGERIYAFTSVFAPTRINTTVIHEWQHYDETKKSWVTASRIPFEIVGGRDGGYRGYSFKDHTQPGRWRVNIKTDRNQLIGRLKFEITSEGSGPPLETVTL